MSQSFDFERLVELCRHTHEETRRSAARAVDRSLVVRNWLFGWYIVEYEQSGADRAEYGRQTLKKLSESLKERIGRGFSVDILEQMRRFYRSYEHVVADVSATGDFALPSRVSGDQSIPETMSRISRDQSISETVSRISSGFSPETAPSFARLAELFPLGWSHYVTLLSVTDPEARRFYEIEAALTTAGASANSSGSSTAPCTSGSRSAATSTKSAASPARVRWSRRRRT